MPMVLQIMKNRHKGYAESETQKQKEMRQLVNALTLVGGRTYESRRSKLRCGIIMTAVLQWSIKNLLAMTACLADLEAHSTNMGSHLRAEQRRLV